MKKKILSIAFGLILIAIGTTTYAADKNFSTPKKTAVIEKVSKDFGLKFRNATNPIITASNNGFIVRSEIDGHKITSAYNIRGNWVYTIDGYSMNSLDANIIETAMPNYKNYFITAMEKVDQPGTNSIYLVHIEGDKSFKTLRISNSTTQLIQDVTKA